MRAQQEKAADKQAEVDELRARRYQEAKEREWREKEVFAKEQQMLTMKGLSKAREAQKAAKIRQLADMARVEQQEFQRVLEANRQKEQQEVAQVCYSLLVCSSDAWKRILLIALSLGECHVRLHRMIAFNARTNPVLAPGYNSRGVCLSGTSTN